MITAAFPVPDRLVRHAFGLLRLAASGTPAQKAAVFGAEGPDDLPRPWEPASCPPTLRASVWLWLDEVAGWINQEYSWQLHRMIPGCWPAHRHISNELAVAACLRYDAGLAVTADVLEYWHRVVLVGFLDRMAERLGSNGCVPGRHQDWPGASRHKDYQSPAAVQRRVQAFDTDTDTRDRTETTTGPDRTTAANGVSGPDPGRPDLRGGWQ